MSPAYSQNRVRDADDAGNLLRRNRDFWLLLTGSSISMLGTRMSTIAYPLLVLAITGSPVIAGWACFAATTPGILFYLPAGALVDRCNPRRAMLLCESLRGLVIASVAVALIFWDPTVAQLIVAAVLEGLLEVFSTLAERRFARSLMDPSNAAPALAQNEARTHMVVLAGRPLGAVLFGITRALPFLADSLSFGICVGILLRIRNHQGANCPERSERHLRREIGEGLEWLRTHPFARVALPLTFGTTLIGQALIMVFLGEAHTHRLGSTPIGMVLAASGVGGALGSSVASWLFRRFGYSLLRTQLSVWTATFACLFLSGGQSFAGMAIAMAILGFTGALGNMALNMYIVQNAAETILARVMSVGRLVSFCALALGPLLGGVLLKQYGAQGAVVVLLIFAGLLEVAAFIAPGARTHCHCPG